MNMEVEVSKDASVINPDLAIEEALKKEPHAAIEILLPVEKQTRMAGEFSSNSKVIGTIVDVCLKASDWNLLNEQISSLSKKRGIIKQSISSMFQRCLAFAEESLDHAVKQKLLKMVREHSEGKVYVEVERAQATRALASILEAEGKLTDAFELMQEVAVETFGSMPRQEKYDFILEQVCLALSTDQFAQAQIISRKINPKIFKDHMSEEFQKLNVKYAELMVRLNLHFQKYLECAKACRTLLVNNAFVDGERVFTQTILFLLLSPYDREQHELIHIMLQDKRIKSAPVLGDLVRTFLKKELIRWQTVEKIASTSGLFGGDVFAKTGWLQDLQRRVVEHNVRVIAELYSRLTLSRMAELLNLDPDTSEATLTGMINSRAVNAKIDRFEGIVTFKKVYSNGQDEQHALLNQWASQVDSLLALMVKTNHMISKEETTHALKAEQK